MLLNGSIIFPSDLYIKNRTVWTTKVIEVSLYMINQNLQNIFKKMQSQVYIDAKYAGQTYNQKITQVYFDCTCNKFTK